jgi:hypothetical protein
VSLEKRELSGVGPPWTWHGDWWGTTRCGACGAWCVVYVYGGQCLPLLQRRTI